MNSISLPKLKRKHFLCRGDLLVHYVLFGAPSTILQHPSLHLLWENSGYGYNSSRRSDPLRDTGMWVPIRKVVQIALD